MENPIERKRAADEPVLGMLVTMPSPHLTQTLAANGLDWLMLDMEHGPIDLGAIHAMTALEVFNGEERYVPEHLTKDADIPLRPGTRLRQRTPGGGGFGDPLERDPERVAEDVRQGYVSVQAAREQYGVLLSEQDTGAVQADEAATKTLRKAMREERLAAAF